MTGADISVKPLLLSDEDLREVHRSGIDYYGRNDLYVEGSGDKIVLTVLGLRLFRYAVNYWGVDADLAKVESEADLHQIAFELHKACISSRAAVLRRDLVQNKVPASDLITFKRFRLAGVDFTKW